MSWIDCGLAREVRRAVQPYSCDGGTQGVHNPGV